GLRLAVHVASGYYPTGQPSYVSGSRPAIVSMKPWLHDFGAPKLEACPYPSTTSVRRSAPSAARLTGKPLMGLSWLSYSSPGFSSPDAEEGQLSGFACRQVENSPRQPS